MKTHEVITIVASDVGSLPRHCDCYDTVLLDCWALIAFTSDTSQSCALLFVVLVFLVIQLQRHVQRLGSFAPLSDVDTPAMIDRAGSFTPCCVCVCSSATVWLWSNLLPTMQ